MKQRNDIEKRVDETLNSLDGIQRAEPQPWLFSRVKGQVDAGRKNNLGNDELFFGKTGYSHSGALLYSHPEWPFAF